KDLEDLFHNFYDEYFDASKIIKSSTTNVESSNVEVPSHEEVFHENSETFQEESSSSSLNDDVQQSSEEVGVPSSNTQAVSNNVVPNVDEANHVYALDKALYGLKQAPRAWYDVFLQFLIDSGFQKGSIDTTLFIKK
nr:reverse transcriptase [Tanacetum cinerariifolium]